MSENRPAVHAGDGCVIWITGLSGSGKSTLAKMLHARIRRHTPAVVLVDGDVFRSVFMASSTYSNHDRKRVAQDIGRLCKFLSDQGLIVVCAAMGLFHEVQQWNRENYARFFEVYLHADLDVLATRKELYRKARTGEVTNVVGVDLPYEAPLHPDFTIDTGSIDLAALESKSDEILARSNCVRGEARR